MDQKTVLVETLRLAVPMEIERLRGLSQEHLCEISGQAATVVGQHGDDLQFGGKYCASTFAALARGLAALALTAWGGVDFAGLHWCQRRTCPGRNAHHDQPHWPDQARLEPPTTRPVETVPTHGLT